MTLEGKITKWVNKIKNSISGNAGEGHEDNDCLKYQMKSLIK
jgi:hypothetical protein